MKITALGEHRGQTGNTQQLGRARQPPRYIPRRSQPWLWWHGEMGMCPWASAGAAAEVCCGSQHLPLALMTCSIFPLVKTGNTGWFIVPASQVYGRAYSFYWGGGQTLIKKHKMWIWFKKCFSLGSASHECKQSGLQPLVAFAEPPALSAHGQISEQNIRTSFIKAALCPASPSAA